MKILEKKNIFVEKGNEGEIFLTYDPNVNYDFKDVEDEAFVNTVTGDRITYGDLVVKVNDNMTDIYLYPLDMASSTKAINDYKIGNWVSMYDPRAKDQNDVELEKIVSDLSEMTGDLLYIVKMLTSRHPNLDAAINKIDKKYKIHQKILKRKTSDVNKNTSLKNNKGFEVMK